MIEQMLDWVIECEDEVPVRVHGPFDSAQKAVKWAHGQWPHSAEFDQQTVWQYTYMSWAEAQRTVETGHYMKRMAGREG